MSTQVDKCDDTYQAVSGKSKSSSHSRLARRVLRVVLGLYFTMAISITALQLLLEYRNEKHRLVSEIEQVARTFQPIVLQALWNLDEAQVKASLEGILGTNQDVLTVELQDVEGNTTHLLNRNNMPAAGVASKSGGGLVERYFFEFDLIYRHEYTGEQKLGKLIFVTNSSVVFKRASHTFYITIISAFIKTTILCFIFYIAVKKMIGKPMEYLSEVMGKLIPSTGNFSSPIELDKELLARDDEVGHALQTFQKMKDSLRSKEASIVEYQNHLEEKVNERTRQLEEASQAKSDFLASMSHEIRTPMNGVLGMVQLLADTRLDEQQKKYINIIQNSGESLIEIINGILDQLKIEAGKIELEARKINLEKLVDDCAAMFSFKSRETGVALLPVFNTSCPRWVLGDATRIKQILNNLIANAFKFTHEGEVVLRVDEVRVEAENKRVIRFTVSDTGIGIDQKALARLFQPFSQADKSTTRKYGGTGLGLTISKQLAELMGGDIRVRSRVGKGSTFEVDLPFELYEKEKLAETDANSELLKGKKLLVVDDHSAFGELIYEITDGWGMRVETVSFGDQARTLIADGLHRNDPYDVAVVDIALPDTNGISLCKELKELHGDKMPKILLVSAVKSADSLKKLGDSGVGLFVEKPISNYELRDCLVKLLAEPESGDSADGEKDKKDRFNDLKVLVVEDNAVNQIVIRGLLNKIGIEPDLAENGLLAVQACEQQLDAPYDLILMDCEMPEMDGWEASRSIRAMNYLRKNGEAVQIHALSAHAMEKHLEKSREAGMDGYMYKPVNNENLLALLNKIKAET